jgi:hypothetical protein
MGGVRIRNGEKAYKFLVGYPKSKRQCYVGVHCVAVVRQTLKTLCVCVCVCVCVCD